MGLYKINLGRGGVIWTGDGGLEMLNKAFKEEVERMSGGLDYKQLKDEDMRYYKQMTALELLEIWKDDLSKEEYERLKVKFTKNEE